MSEHAAYNRLVAARLARQFPSILLGLADGSLNLTNVRLLAPHLTAENHGAVLARAAGRSKREVEVLVAELAPQPDLPSTVRKRRAANPPGMSAGRADAVPAADAHGSRVELESQVEVGSRIEVPLPVAAPPAAEIASAQMATVRRLPAPPTVAPLSPGRYRVQFTIDEETYEDLRWTQNLLRRQIPTGDVGAIFARALRLLRAEVAKERTAATAKTADSRPGTDVVHSAAGSRHIPASVKRAVWLRDRGQCAFVARLGRRCAERSFLELHHLQPFAKGGEATIANLSLRCRRHNAYEAELDFGARVPVPVGQAMRLPIGEAAGRSRRSSLPR